MKKIITLFALFLLASCNSNTTSSGAMPTTSTSGSVPTSNYAFMENKFYIVHVEHDSGSLAPEGAIFYISTSGEYSKFTAKGVQKYDSNDQLMGEWNVYYFYNNTYYLDTYLDVSGTHSYDYSKFFVISDDLIIGEPKSSNTSTYNYHQNRFVTIEFANNNNIEVRSYS